MSAPNDYRELTSALLTDAAERGVPINGTFELTSRCNLGCAMCYIRTRAADRAMKATELTAEQWVDLGRQAVDAGMLFLLLTGGEVFLRPDFFDIYEPLRDMGLMLTLFTNATMVTPAIAKRLARRPPNRFEVTIYGATEKTYEAVTRQPGSYKRFIRGMEALLEAGLRPKIKSTLSRLNVHEFEEMERMSEEWGSKFSAAWMLTRRRDEIVTPVDIETIRISPSEAMELEMRDPAGVEKLKKLPDLHELDTGHEAFFCSAGRNSFVIGPSGDMNICIDLCLPRARPTEIGFLPAWEQVKAFVASVPPSEDCSNCDLNQYCIRCPAWSLIETGSVSKSVPYLCGVASERKKTALRLRAR